MFSLGPPFEIGLVNTIDMNNKIINPLLIHVHVEVDNYMRGKVGTLDNLVDSFKY